MEIIPINTEFAKPWIIKKHYAHRMPCVQYAFGLFDNYEMLGVCTFGTPSSSPLRKGICGEGFKVLELNRLIIESKNKNSASKLIGNSIKHLPTCVLVSYADTKQGHIGYVYQATNWHYTGLSAKRTDWNIEGLEHLHSQTIADKTKGLKDRAKTIRNMYGDRFSLVDRSRKHRYIYFVGNRYEKKKMLSELRYQILPYPKGESKRYVASTPICKQMAFL